MGNKTISVIVPIYNNASFLRTCLDSIVNQTYKNLEIILIDDGSIDNSSSICDEYKEKDDRVKVVHQKNSGVSVARNTGLSIATGDYIGFVDSDDCIELNMYERFINIFDQYNVELAFCNYLLENGDGTKTFNDLKMIGQGVCNKEYALWSVLVRPGYITAIWNKIYKRNIIFDNNNYLPFDDTLTVGEDQIWIQEIIERCKNVYLLDESLYHWRVRVNSASRQVGITKQRFDELRVAEKTYKKYAQKNLKLKRATLVKLYLVAAMLLLDEYKHKQKKELMIIKKDIKLSWKEWLLYGDTSTLKRVLSVCKALVVSRIWK